MTAGMPVSRATTSEEIRAAIAAEIALPRLRITDVAAMLDCSRSAVQRALAKDDTHFTAELLAAREERARCMLTLERRSVSTTAAGVGVTPDHLRALLEPMWGVTPGDVRRAVVLLQRIRAWKRSGPPASKSQWYWAQKREWDRALRDLDRLLGPIRKDADLRGWADERLRFARRPDYRRRPYRDGLSIKRDRERRERDARIREILSDREWPGLEAGGEASDGGSP
jgi:AraC-like DNA-binding protein